MEYIGWFWQLVPDSRLGLRIVTIAILSTFLFVLVLAVVTSIATIVRGQPPWRWGGDGMFRRTRRTARHGA